MGPPLAHEGQQVSEERPWLPSKASGEEKADKEETAERKRCLPGGS